MDDLDFRRHAEETLAGLKRLLATAAEDFGFDVRLEGDTLSVRFSDPPTKIVVRPHKQTRQMWVTDQSKTYKFDWDVVEAAFILPETGEYLREVVERSIGHHLKEEFSL